MTKGTESNEGEDEPNESEDDAMNVRFDDSEDGKMTAFNDIFEVIEIDRPRNDSNKIEIKRRSYMIKVCTTKSSMKKLTKEEEEEVEYGCS